MAQGPESDMESDLMTDVLAALRELTVRSETAYDLWDDDGHGGDTWRSEDFTAAVDRAKAVLARIDAGEGEPDFGSN